MRVRLVKYEDDDDLSAFTPEQRAQLHAYHARQTGRVDRVLGAIYRACMGVAREIRPDKFDGEG
jgi:hypothetical protein